MAKRRFSLLLLLAVPVVMFSQRTTEQIMSLRCFVTQIGHGSGPIVSANCIDIRGVYNGFDIEVGDTLFYVNDGAGYKLPIDSIIQLGVPTSVVRLNLTGLDPLLSVPTGAAAIYEPSISGINGTIGGMTEADNQYLMDDMASRVGTGSADFDSDRAILRLYQVGTVVGGTSVNDMFEWLYFAPPTITCNLSPTTTVYEVGTTNSITISGSVSNPGNATLSNGALTRTVPASNVVNSFGSATSYTSTISFTPTKNGSGDYNLLSYSFRATQDWVKNAENGTATSVTRTVTAVYPVLYGMSATDLSQGGNPYTELTKLVQTEGNKTVTFTGTSQYMYYAVPKTWSDYDLSQIIDHNGFNVTNSFTAYDVIVSSSGLSNDWIQEYKLYKLNTLTNAQGFAYQFIR